VGRIVIRPRSISFSIEEGPMSNRGAWRAASRLRRNLPPLVYRDFRERVRFVDGLFLGLFMRFRDWPDSDIAIAIACLRLFTLRPLPLRSAPRLSSPMTFDTLRLCRLVAMNLLRLHGFGRAGAAPILTRN